MWQALGKLQFDFLVESGLKSRCTLLDIGCGTLRGGRHFVAFLDRGRYTGIDISPKAIEYARQLVHDEGLCDKRPRLLVNEDLTFREFEGENFDFLLAQSVFTHLPAENIAECLRHVGAVMGRDSVFHFTFNEAPQVQRTDLKTFSYPFSFFESLAEQSGFHLEDCGDSYKHPRGQRMARLWRAAAGRPG
jgi:SAM-dependent methyltransferase